MGKTRDLFKKIKRYQRNISCKDGLNKGQKWYGPNRSRRLRSSKNTQKDYTKKIFMTHITTMVISLTQSQTYWNVKSNVRSITTNKASGGDGIPAELLQILKDDAVKVLHSIRQLIWKTQQWSQNWKSSVFIPVPKKDNAKDCSNYHTIALIPQASKVMLEILQVSLQQYVN